jgi:hypothetical protein
MSICQNGDLGQHRWVWTATLDGKGYWLCMNANCGEVQIDGTGHNGG